mgnify:CR=1 FL=1
MSDPRWEYLNRFSLAYALNSRLAAAGSRAEAAEIVLPELESDLGAEVALLIMVHRATGRPTVFGGDEELRRELGSHLRSLPPRALQEALGSGLEIAGQPRTMVVPVSIGTAERGALLVAGPRHFGDPDRIALEAVATLLGVLLHKILLLEELDRSYGELRRIRDGGTQQQRLEALEQLSAGLARELSQVLLPVPAYSAYLLSSDPDLTERQRGAIRQIYEAGVDASAVLARMRRGVERARDRQEKPVPLRIAPLVSDLVERHRYRWEDDDTDHPVRVRVEIEDDLPRVWARAPEIGEAVTELLMNAMDATRGGGRIVVRARQALEAEARGEDSAVVIEVIDTGIGMSGSNLDRCRDPFFSTKADPGAGLGLSQAQSVARRFGGRLALESVVGQGTTAALIFPAWVAEDEDGPEPSLRILCLDEDAEFRSWVSQVLSFQGHRVTTAAGVRQGVATFVEALKEEEPFHVVILGTEAEGRPEPGLLDAFRGTDPDVLTILAGPWALQRSERESVVAVVAKPPATGALEELVRRIALGRRAGR